LDLLDNQLMQERIEPNQEPQMPPIGELEALEHEFRLKNHQSLQEITNDLRGLVTMGLKTIAVRDTAHSLEKLAMMIEQIDRSSRIISIEQISEQILPDVLGLREKVQVILSQKEVVM